MKTLVLLFDIDTNYLDNDRISNDIRIDTDILANNTVKIFETVYKKNFENNELFITCISV